MSSLQEDLSLQREQLAWQLRTTQALTHEQISDRLQIPRRAVTDLLNRRSRKINQELDALVFEQKVSQLGLLEMFIMECMEAFTKSKSGTTIVTRTTQKRKLVSAENPSSTVSDQVTTTTQQARASHGEIRYLTEARSCMRDIRSLLGIQPDPSLQDWRVKLPDGYDPEHVLRSFAQLMLDGPDAS